jgi:hypothetical protein
MENGMSEEEAKELLTQMLSSFTVGGITQMLADLFRQYAVDAEKLRDEVRQDQCRKIEAAMLVIGLGCDAILPT